VSGNRVLKSISGSRREEVREGWRKFHNELRELISSKTIVRVIKSKRMRLS
jgi:hypothetical protein